MQREMQAAALPAAFVKEKRSVPILIIARNQVRASRQRFEMKKPGNKGNIILNAVKNLAVCKRER
jgi:hypothetical protein